MDKKETTETALLLIDVISDFEFEDGEKLFEYALPMAKKLAAFKKRAVKAGIPVIYVNDNFGQWQEDFQEQVKYCLKKSVRGHKIVELLKPDNKDYYALKPRHSAFYQTVLEHLLSNLQIKTLILTGVATDICILFTANDAFMRQLKIIIPRDCVAAVNPQNSEAALDYMKRVLEAEIIDSEKFDFDKLKNS
jgi:nicotinamidase-related amidase